MSYTYHRADAEEPEVDPKAAKTLVPGRLLDLMVLVLALDATKTVGAPDDVLSRGMSLFRQHRGSLEEAMRLHIYPIVERDDAGILQSKTHLFEAVQPERKARFIELLLEWLHRHPTLLRDVFSGRAYGNAQKVTAAVSDMDPKTRLQKLSLVPTSSGLSAPLRWIDKAADAVGVAPSAVDAVASHAEAAQGIVDEIRTVKTELEATPPQSLQAAQLQQRKVELDVELDAAIRESDNPQAVLASATASMAQNPTSRIAKEFGLTEEQAAVVASKGNVVVAAGAGSGKTQTAVAWIASLVKEQGYAPEQILTCSFTRAASSELEGRVRTQGGVQGAEIGTTHHMARMVIQHAHPELDKVLKSTKNADKCFKIALKQVPLSTSGHSAQLEANKEQLAKIEAISGWRSNDFLQSLHGRLERGQPLTPGQLGALEKWSRPRYPTYQRRRWAEDYSEPTIVKAAEGGSDDQFSQYWSVPIGEWFNLGEDLVDAAGKPVGFKRASLAVENFKNSGMSAEQAWQENKDKPGFDRLMAAVYGAYEWLKKNDPVLAPAMDYTDQLVKALDILRTEPKVLESLQRRFKVVIVDEAQDLNQIQFDFFGLLGAKADVLAYVGDDKQCVHEDTMISVHGGETCVRDLRPGASVLANRNGKIVPQTVRHVVKSSWTQGFKITTDGGHTLTMSPNHKIWASEPVTDGQEQMAVYLMYRRDLGFRVGITNKGKMSGRGDALNSYGGRAFMEKAERMWILDICPNRETALLQEERYSLQYGIPTMVFNGTNRGISQARVESIFEEFGKNGARLLESRHLRFDLPHWMSQSYTKHGRARRTIHLIAHSPSNTQVALEWSEPDLDEVLAGQYKRVEDCRRIRRWFANYRDALAYASELAKTSGANLRESLSTPEARLYLFTASGLFSGMRVAVLDSPETGVVLETITAVEPASGNFYDLDVDDASNFFGGGILSHNSIYAFRGAKPKNYVDLTKKEGFQTKSITMNFRSGKAIVDAANRLIAHNEDRQIPMVCEADVVRKGMGEIVAKEVETHEDAATIVAQEIKDAVDAGESLNSSNGKPRFGILVRNNAEADAYTLSLLARGIPYRMLKRGEGGYFGKPLVKALIAWMSLATNQNVNDAIVEAHMTPGFGLDKAFSRQLGVMARGSYLDHILAGRAVYDGRAAWKNGKNVAPYADAIRGLLAKGTSDSETLIRNILAIRGSKGTFEDALILLVDEEDVIEDEGSLEPSAAAIREAAMAPLRPLMEMARNFTDPENFMRFVAKMKAANEKAQKKEPTEADDWKEPAVLVGTVHGWKGLQAKHVYVSMAGGVFPSYRTDEKAAEDPTAYDEERRLAYVAITRGEDSVTIMSPQVGYTGKPATPSRFISEACLPVQGQPKAETEEAVSTPDGEPVEPDSGMIEKMASGRFGYSLVLALEEIPALEPPP